MINKALCTENINILIHFRMLIRDVQNQLSEERVTTPIYVYRSQLMSQEELDVIEHIIDQSGINEVISLNYFRSSVCSFSS